MRGAMGEVWVATHLALDVRVAVKILPEHFALDSERRARFELEARIAARLSRRSRHIVGVLDYGVERGYPWFAMELVEGETLERRLDDGWLEAEETIAILDQLALGLAAAHEEGIVHRDLKPSNVLLTRTDGELVVKLTDFGIAKASEARVRTGRHIALGTPHHMSPEQARATADLDVRCDVWGLATVAYECLTGEPAFAGATVAEVITKVCRCHVASVRAHRLDLDRGVDDVFRVAFASRIEDRFASGGDLVEALSLALGCRAPRSRRRRSSQ